MYVTTVEDDHYVDGCGKWGIHGGKTVPAAGVDYLVIYLVTTDAPTRLHLTYIFYIYKYNVPCIL